MKLRTNQLAWALAGIGLVTGLAGCGGGSGSGTVTSTPKAQATAGIPIFNIEFVDASNGKLITDPLTVSFSGASVADGEVRQIKKDANGNYLPIEASFTTSNGVVAALAFFNGSNDSFKISASGSNWLASSVEIVPSTGSKVTIRMMNKVAPDSSYTASTASGTTAADLTAATTTLAGSGSATLTLPAGITATGAATNALTLSVVRYADGTDPLQLGNGLQGGTFSLGDRQGLARFTVTDSAGKVITDFANKTLTLSIELPAGAKFPNTNTALVGGETNYPIWYFNETSKQWVTHSSNGTVTKNPDNSFKVTFTSTHLSLWSLNEVFDPASSCVLSTLNLTGRPAGNATPLTLNITGTGFNKTISPVTDSSLTLLYAPKGPINVSVTSPAGVSLTSGSVDLSSCPLAPVSLNLTGLTPPTPATLTVTVTESCSNSTSFSRASPTSVYFEYQLPSGLFTTLGGWTGDDGIIDLPNIPSGTTGTLKIWNQYKTPSAGYVEYSGFAVSAPTTLKTQDFPVLNCGTGATGGSN